MTGLEAYSELKAATAELPIWSEFAVQASDAIDLQKLTVTDLEDRGYDHSVAVRTSADLMTGSLDELGKSMGLCLVKDPKAHSLQPRRQAARAVMISYTQG